MVIGLMIKQNPRSRIQLMMKKEFLVQYFTFKKKKMIVLKRLKMFSKITVKYEIIFYLKYILVNINIFFHISFISYHKSFLAQ